MPDKNNTSSEQKVPITEEKRNELNKAAHVLCDFCENDECDSCQVTRLLDDAESEYQNTLSDEN